MGALHRRWREFRRRGGDFAVLPTDAATARATLAWDAGWAACPPSGPDLRAAHPHRWLRLWSLPGGKRTADDGAEHAVVLHRYRSVLSALHPTGSPVLVVGADWGPLDGAGGWTRRHLSGRRPWRTSTDLDEDVTTYFWIAESAPADLDDLLGLAAEDAAHIIATPSDMSWAFAPYEGGADVFVVDAEAREALRARYAGWLSTRADGL